MKSFLSIIGQALLATKTIAQTIPYQTFDTSGSVQTATSGSQFVSISGTWSYPTTLENPVFEPGTYFYTQYVAIDLLPNICQDFIQVGTNITLDSTNSTGGTHGGFGFYVWNNVTTEITDANGDVVQFLDGDTVTVTISISDNGQDAAVSFNSTRSGITELSLEGGSLCLQHIQWAIGGAPQEVMPDFDNAFFKNATAGEGPISGTTGELTVVTPEGGSLVNLVKTEDGIDNIQAEPEEVSGEGMRIEFQPDD